MLSCPFSFSCAAAVDHKLGAEFHAPESFNDCMENLCCITVSFTLPQMGASLFHEFSGSFVSSFISPVQPSRISCQAFSKSPVYHGSATPPDRFA